MAEVVQEKSRGLKFAEQQLLRHGWEHGKGLGRAENGIAEAIKVKVKCDKGGVGHKEGEQFTFHWWDHVFNKASSSLQVEADQNGIKLKKTVEEEEATISNKRPRVASLAKAKLYGCFVKSATLLSGQEQPEPKSSSSSSSDDSSSSEEEKEEEEDDQKLDLSSTTKLSDADLMKVCGGRTAHKGARHGLTMSAKLARLEQQEAEFMAKYGKKSQAAPPTSQAERQEETTGETTEDSQRKKTKKKRTTDEEDVKLKKKKKRKADDAEERSDVENCDADQTTKKKHKKKKKKRQEEDERSPAAESDDLEAPAELHTDATLKQKKKKKKKSSKRHGDAVEDEESNDRQSDDARVEEVTETTVKQKRKKCKKDKTSVDDGDGVDEEALPPKKKKKKKSKD